MSDKPSGNDRPIAAVPVLPLRDVVVYPAHGDPAVRGPREIHARAGGGHGGRQADPAGRADAAPDIDDPAADDLYKVGTLATSCSC